MASAVSTTPKVRRWTRMEYERLVELGVFQSGERLELLDGLLAVREPQGTGHAAGIRRVLRVLQEALGTSWQIDSQLPIALDDYSEPEPDVAVVPRVRDLYLHEHPSRAVLIVEVAETSYRIDRRYKASLYARAGIAEYWILDVASERLEVHRGPEAAADAVHGWRYGRVAKLRRGATVTPLFVPDVAIRVADLLP
jgi:Uma2 family endonuclease